MSEPLYILYMLSNKGPCKVGNRRFRTTPRISLKIHLTVYITLVNVYVDLLVFTRIAGTS